MSKVECFYRLTGHQRIISGNRHHLVERSDGCRFYLDDAFLFILENRSNPLQDDDLAKLGIDCNEIQDVQFILQSAGLTTLQEKNESEK